MESILLLSDTFFIFLFSFVIAYGVSPALAVDKRYEDCRLPISCGSHRYNRTYPFWGHGKPPYCGVRDLELKCWENQYLLIEIGGQTLRVLNIDESGTITVAQDSLWGSRCPETLEVSEMDREYLWPQSVVNVDLYTCESISWIGMGIYTFRPISCNATKFYLFPAGEPALHDCQKSFSIPVPMSVRDSLFPTHMSVSAMETFKKGFQLVYRKYAMCRKCTMSGGICGRDSDSDNFQCFCEDKPYEIVCGHDANSINGKRKVITIFRFVIVFVTTLLVFLGFIGCRTQAKRLMVKYHNNSKDKPDDYIIETETLQFDFRTIEISTNCFSNENKIGSGGFGVVYKGILPDGQEVAIKRLSSNSNQGVGEFKNEATIVAKLQHRNLVRLLGFCLKGEEKLLVYEFVPNKSLDYFLFDPKQGRPLDWQTRYKIISGVARGLLYLHRDSRLRIIHRDIKASNILLDFDMNPKISDFGMAKIFNVDQSQGNTNRIAGTFGYMSPEYAMYGWFSMKSDIYSFGVLLLEIIIGLDTMERGIDTRAFKTLVAGR